ncbi:MAG TPA: hypothetical protein VGF16_17930 [Bryobacteraceae bacterium]
MIALRFQSRICWAAAFLAMASQAQTACSIAHTAPGAFICFPLPSNQNEGVPALFHLSAQGNASEGGEIRGYSVEIDGREIYQNRLGASVQRLSIETNLNSGFTSGSHTVRVVFDGAGVTEPLELRFRAAGPLPACNPFVRFEPYSCALSGTGGRFRWSVEGTAPNPAKTPAALLAGYSEILNLYGRNLKSVEADIADAMAVDAQGNLYVASHANADIELRRYSSSGSLSYDNLVRSCGDGYVSVTGLALGGEGRVWITGVTTGCLQATERAYARQPQPADSRPRGFVISLDTRKPGNAEPAYVTYLSEIPCRPTALRVDREGNAYVAGTTDSLDYPHAAVLPVGGVRPGATYGFVSVLNPEGSGQKWSTLIQGATLNSLALDGAGGVFVTGRISRNQSSANVLVAGISDAGRRLAYAAEFGGSGRSEGRAISAIGDWMVVLGATNSTNLFKDGTTAKAAPGLARNFWLAVQPCAGGRQYGQLFERGIVDSNPELAILPSLDAFAALRPNLAALSSGAPNRSLGIVHAAPECQGVGSR